jgi:hypothetical protein
MKETPLVIVRNDDPTLFVLGDEQKPKAKKALNDIFFAGTELMKRAEDGSLEQGFKTTLCSLMESYTTELNKQFGYNGKLAEEQEERTATVRRLNIENRELRKQLGEKVSSEDVREKLKNLSDAVNKWWQEAGTGFVSDGGFGSWGAYRAKLSGMLFNDENRAALEAQGIRFNDERHHAQMISCDASIAGVLKLLTDRFPSAHIESIETFGGRNGEAYTVREIRFAINDLNEI